MVRVVRRIVAVGLVLVLAGCAQTTPQWVAAGHATPSHPATASPTAAAQRTFTLSAVGDTILGDAPGHLPPHDGTDLFADVTTALQSDLQMANLEEPLADVKTSPKCSAAELNKTCFAFRAPSSYAAAAQGRRLRPGQHREQPHARLRHDRPQPDRTRADRGRYPVHRAARAHPGRHGQGHQDRGARVRAVRVGEQPAQHPGRPGPRAPGQGTGRHRHRAGAHGRRGRGATSTSRRAPRRSSARTGATRSRSATP